jgi:hypothetical protein
VKTAANDNRLPPPPFWRTSYFEDAMTRPDRRTIGLGDVKRALEQPYIPIRTARRPSEALGLGNFTAALVADHR